MMVVTDTLEAQPCPNCGIRFAAPASFFAARRKDCGKFYCPNGHVLSWHETDADRLRQERDLLKQRLAQKDDELKHKDQQIESIRSYWQDAEDRVSHESRRVSAAKGQVTKLKNRAAAGVCPCCSRSFQNLKSHMATKHPAFAAEVQAADNVIPLKSA